MAGVPKWESRVTCNPPIARPRETPYHDWRTRPRRRTMKKVVSSLVALALAAVPLVTIQADTKETERLENCGKVLQDILNIPDNIPQSLMDRSECIIVIPSVIKG